MESERRKEFVLREDGGGGGCPKNLYRINPRFDSDKANTRAGAGLRSGTEGVLDIVVVRHHKMRSMAQKASHAHARPRSTIEIPKGSQRSVIVGVGVGFLQSVCIYLRAGMRTKEREREFVSPKYL